MFGWLFGNRYKRIEEETKKGFEAVKKDMDLAGKWIKHLNTQDKQLFDNLNEIRNEIATIRDELGGLREALEEIGDSEENKQLLGKMPVLRKQTAVFDVQKAVQTAVQTANFYDILRNLTSNERLLVLTLMNSDLKLSYEDLALLLGKERATIRGQVNSIKQKSEGLILEISEKNGKKRVYIPDEIKEKLAKYAKVRVRKKDKSSS
jgi:regulator of replication initiation timing